MSKENEGKVLAALEKWGARGLSREVIFQTLPGSSYHQIEQLLTKMAKKELVRLQWIGPNNFVVLPLEKEIDDVDTSTTPPPPPIINDEHISEISVSQPEAQNVSELQKTPLVSKVEAEPTEQTMAPAPPKSVEQPIKTEVKTMSPEPESVEYVVPHCPFMNKPCIGEECAIYIDEEGCSIAVLAVRGK